MRVLTHIKKLEDCFGQFMVRATCPCGFSREIEPEALARLVGWLTTLESTGVAPALLTVREEGGGGRRGGEAQAAGRIEESALKRPAALHNAAADSTRGNGVCSA